MRKIKPLLFCPFSKQLLLTNRYLTYRWRRTMKCLFCSLFWKLCNFNYCISINGKSIICVVMGVWHFWYLSEDHLWKCIYPSIDPCRSCTEKFHNWWCHQRKFEFRLKGKLNRYAMLLFFNVTLIFQFFLGVDWYLVC